MSSINNKIRRAGELFSDLIQRDTYDLLANERGGNGHHQATKGLYAADLNLRGRPTLNLSMRELRAVPKQAFRQKNLQILKLNGNFLQALPFELARLRQLEELYLQNNKLEFVPAQVCGLVSLQVLDFSYNELTILPYSIANLRSLRVLDLAYNNIRILPDSLAFLQMLESLDLDGNALREIPESVTKLSYLTVLKLRHNLIRDLPRQLTKLKKLQELYLTGNTISKSIHESVKGFLMRITKVEMDFDISTAGGNAAVVNCLTSNQRKGSKYDKVSAAIPRNSGVFGEVMDDRGEQDTTEYSENGDPIYNFTSYAFRNVCRLSKKETAI